MNHPDQFDVVIIGGGPAGSCAALRLLDMGYHVALIEKEFFPRNQIGESLSPGIWNIFNLLQASHLLEEPSYLCELQAKIIWDTRSATLVDATHRGPGIMVDRGKLDADLIQLAVERGLHLFQPAKYESCQKEDGSWQLNIRHNNNSNILITTFILDARGRYGTNASDRILTAPPTIAIWTHISANKLPFATVVEALETGWLWGSPMPDNQFRIMAFADPKELKNNLPQAFLSSLLSKSELFKSALEAVNISKAKTCTSLTYFHADPWKDSYARLGECAFSLDPLSSTGVEKAMRFSFQTAIAVNTVLKEGKEELSKCFYQDRMIEAIVNHTNWTKDYYKKAWPGAALPFWQNRSQPFLQNGMDQLPFVEKVAVKLNSAGKLMEEAPPKKINIQELLPCLWNKKIQVSTDLSYIQTACVVDSHLELKTAINHPRLNREIAYLEQVEIAPLLMMVEPAYTFGEIVYYWSNVMPYKQAIKTAIFLWELDILHVHENN